MIRYLIALALLTVAGCGSAAHGVSTSDPASTTPRVGASPAADHKRAAAPAASGEVSGPASAGSVGAIEKAAAPADTVSSGQPAATPPAKVSAPKRANAPAECEALVQRINQEGERIKAATDVYVASRKDKAALEIFIVEIGKARDAVRSVPVKDKALSKLAQRYPVMLDWLIHGARTVHSVNPDVQRKGLEELESIDAEETEIIEGINGICI